MANLLSFLKTNENARKIFGKRELKIIEKQLQGISLTQSEKNRLSRDIRKKLEFIKEIARYSDDFELKKGKDIKEKIKETLEEILNDKLRGKIKEIFLFGSAADNQLTFRSDIDIGVEFEDLDAKEATLFRIRIARNVSDKMDIQVWNVLPEKIKESILKNKRTLWKK